MLPRSMPHFMLGLYAVCRVLQAHLTDDSWMPGDPCASSSDSIQHPMRALSCSLSTICDAASRQLDC